eukprot:CAMPEP_0168353598 /NCGR_PEP_ID=MMETSP0213-20121227/23355_1 /TAXON_ID=151035 /ORGANISM="Euplotes harpa, Strain FSP1.4" /LENGTH=105 /DNA_ID=CAMNT_0008365257 /DNA_START=63 /DNA_END=377 /DNA_ORIENTATION=-
MSDVLDCDGVSRRPLEQVPDRDYGVVPSEHAGLLSVILQVLHHSDKLFRVRLCDSAAFVNDRAQLIVRNLLSMQNDKPVLERFGELLSAAVPFSRVLRRKQPEFR